MANTYFAKLRESNPDLPSNVGKYWSDGEEANMLQLLADGKSRQEIAVSLERTEGSITARLNRVACKMFDNSTNVDDILRITCLKKNEFDQAIKKHQASKVEKPKDGVEKFVKKIIKEVMLILQSMIINILK